MQQSVLSRPLLLPTVAHLAPPHWVHSMGQQAMPLSFTPSMPGNPLLHCEDAGVLGAGVAGVIGAGVAGAGVVAGVFGAGVVAAGAGVSSVEIVSPT